LALVAWQDFQPAERELWFSRSIPFDRKKWRARRGRNVANDELISKSIPMLA
jgi:hypothetical protein